MSAWPSSIGIAEFTLTLRRSSASFSSSFTGQRQVTTMNANRADRWEGVIVTPVLSNADLRDIFGWAASLGPYGEFTVGDPDYSGPADSGDGAGLVQGGSQTGKTLTVDSLSGSYNRGEYLMFGEELKIITADVTTSGGAATFAIEPAIRVSPANNAPVDLSTPVVTAHITSMPEKLSDTLKMGKFVMSFEEKISV